MGQGGSRIFSPHHSQGLVPKVKNKDGIKESSWKVKRNSYVICPTQNTQKTPNISDAAEGGVSESTVQDETRLAEVPDVEDTLLNERDEQGGILTRVSDVEGNLHNETDEEEGILTSDRRKSLLSTTYENLTRLTNEEHILKNTISADSATPDHVNYPVDTTENRISTPYVNIKLLMPEGHKPNNTIPVPESVEALSLRRNYRELKDKILLETVCDHLIQDDVLQDIDYEMIKNGSRIRSLRVEILLQIILRQKNQEVFKAFSRILRKTGHEYLADKIENTEMEVLGKPYVRDWSSDLILNSWPQIEKYLMGELQPEYILDFFMQENIFTLDEYEEVFWSMEKRVKMRKKLLKKIKNHLPEAFFVLLYALKEVKKGKEIIAEELEKLVEAGNDRKDASENCHADESTTSVHLMTCPIANFTVKVPPSATNTGCIVKLTIEHEGNAVGSAENEIVKYINNTSNPCMFKLIPLTGCEITKSELGCVTIYLRPHSKHSFDKFFKFCKDKELDDFVLNLLREKDILNSLPEGELCINIKVQYNEKEVEAEGTEEPETDWKKSILDNWSFLCEELDLPNLINGSAKKTTVFTAQETNELEERTSKDRHSAVDYFLQCLLENGQAGINFLIDVLKEKNKKKILNRLQKSGPLYQNPQTVKENIIVYFESIIDEIDPIQFKDTFMDRKLLANTFFTDLMKNLRRRDRAALFLREVINKGNNAIFALLDVMTDMNYDELLSKLVPPQETLLESKEQRQGEKIENISGNVSEMEEPIYMNVPFDNQDEDIGETEEARKDETKKKVLGSTSEEEEPIYENVPFDNKDEVIAERHGISVTMIKKKGRKQPNGPKLHPENRLSSLFELDEAITFPRRRTEEEARNDIHSMITSEDGPVTDNSCVDLNDMNNDPVSKISSKSTPKGFIWSCCLKINVETKMKDETRERIFAISRQKEDPIYMNVPFDNHDEGYGDTDENYITMRSKEGKNQANRPVTHPENSLPHLFEFDKSMTYPRTRESEEARKGTQSIINSPTSRLKDDSCVDLTYDEIFPLKK